MDNNIYVTLLKLDNKHLNEEILEKEYSNDDLLYYNKIREQMKLIAKNEELKNNEKLKYIISNFYSGTFQLNSIDILVEMADNIIDLTIAVSHGIFNLQDKNNLFSIKSIIKRAIIILDIHKFNIADLFDFLIFNLDKKYFIQVDTDNMFRYLHSMTSVIGLSPESVSLQDLASSDNIEDYKTALTHIIQNLKTGVNR